MYYNQAQSTQDPKRGSSCTKVVLLPSTSRISHPCKRPNPDNLILTLGLICRTIGDTRKTITPRSMSLRQASNFDRGSCVAIVRCGLPGCTAPACPPFLPRPRTSPLMLRIPAKSTLGVRTISRAACTGGFRCFFPWSRRFLRLVTCHMHVTAGVQPASRPIRGWTPLWRRHTGSRAARPCGGILYVRKLSLQTTQVFDGTIFSYCRLRDYDAQVRKPVGLSAALILLSSFAVRSVLRRPLLLR